MDRDRKSLGHNGLQGFGGAALTQNIQIRRFGFCDYGRAAHPFDAAVSNVDQQTVEHFARTINKLKGKVTMLFITHQIPRGLAVDEIIELGSNTTRQMDIVEEEK